jgi:hypothetical protein
MELRWRSGAARRAPAPNVLGDARAPAGLGLTPAGLGSGTRAEGPGSGPGWLQSDRVFCT